MTNKDWQQEYLFESRFFDQEGHRQHYIDEGSGEPIVMVHGNPTWSFYYRHLVAGLRDTHRMIAIDHLGCGLSDKPQKFKYRLVKHVHNLSRLVSHLQVEDATLVVHDWGGPIGLGMWLNLPHRFKRIVLLNTGAYPPESIPYGLRVARWPIFGALAVRGLNLFCRKALTSAVAHPESLSDIAKSGLLAPYNNWKNRVAIHNFVVDIPVKPSHPSYQPLKVIENGLGKLHDTPVMMVWGMKDWVFTGDVLDRMTRLIPHAEVHRLEDVGHYVMEEGRDDVIRLISDFLNR